jgi:hypothetical protein
MDVQNYFEVISSYKNLVNEMDSVIKMSGIKTSFLADNLKLSRSAFYSKRKRGTFTTAEIEQLLNIIAPVLLKQSNNIDADFYDDEPIDNAIEDAFFAKMYEERKNEKSVPNSLAILKQQRNERRNQRKLL